MTDAEIKAAVDGHKVDRSGWDRGAWDGEPDGEFLIVKGFRCLIMRSNGTGVLNGYVAVGPSHPWFGADYDSFSAKVHGGLTYSSHEMFKTEGDSAQWWVGFDCAHAGDLSPGIRALMRHAPHPSYETYCDLNYVRRELVYLVEQAHAAQPAPAEPSQLAPTEQHGPLDLDDEIAALEKVLDQ